MVRARGRLERREGVVNVLVDRVEPLELGKSNPPGPLPPPVPQRPSSPAAATVRRNRERAVAELREVAPAGHSFGRRGR